MIIRLDTDTVSLALVAYDEGIRLGRIPPEVSFERWCRDAVWERAHAAFWPRRPEEPGPRFGQPYLFEDELESRPRLRYLRGDAPSDETTGGLR